MKNEKIELEDLLKLKRAESPSESDWVRFDSELKGRLLKEVVEKNKGFSGFGIINGILVVSCSFSIFAVVGYFYLGNITSTSDSFVSSPLPNIETTFFENEFSSSIVSENPVIAQIEGNGNSEIFVSDTVNTLPFLF